LETNTSHSRTEQKCPQCQAIIPVHPDYRTWCDTCDWNIGQASVSNFEDSLFFDVHKRISQKSSDSLFQRLQRETAIKNSNIIVRSFAYVLAGAVHGLTVFIIFIGLRLMFFSPELYRGLGVLLGFLCLLLAWIFLPRFPKVGGALLDRDQFPVLDMMMRRVANSLGIKPVDEIRCDLKFNAMLAESNWGRKKILMLGVPLLAVLSGREIVALMGHELAHCVNRDSGRGKFIGSAIHSLGLWYGFLNISGKRAVNLNPVITIVNFLRGLVANLIWLMGYGLARLLWYESQYAEYQADSFAVKLAGKDVNLTLLTKSLLGEMVLNNLKSSYLRPHKRGNFFAVLNKNVEDVPSQEYQRLMRVSELIPSYFHISHPPAIYRAKYLKSRPVTTPQVEISLDEATRLNTELEILFTSIEKQIFEMDEISFQETFGSIW
jgi:Zn-dependent protease with chaperone function